MLSINLVEGYMLFFTMGTSCRAEVACIETGRRIAKRHWPKATRKLVKKIIDMGEVEGHTALAQYL